MTGFLWGASTASVQNEGGNGRSTFEPWSRKKGWEPPGDACRSWERFEDDLGCLKALNANAYRFSLEWSRLEPEPGRFDEEAFARYLSWIRRLKAEGIASIVCLHHWSEPQWRSKEPPGEDFLRYARAAAERLAPECDDWLVFNEPVNFTIAAYSLGHFPPGGWGRPPIDRFCALHREAARALKAANPRARVGVALNMVDMTGPQAGVERWDRFYHRRFIEGCLDSLDFIGVNYYTRVHVSRLGLPGFAELEQKLGPLFTLLGGRGQDAPRNMMGWTVDAGGLRRVLLRAWKRYGKPLIVTENGMPDTPGLSREQFIKSHVEAMRRAMADGADVRGYLHWSLLDNWEWGSYAPKFGLFTRDRKPKDGAAYFAQLNGSRLAA